MSISSVEEVPQPAVSTAVSAAKWRIPALLAAVTLLAFQGIRSAGFVAWDDNENIYENSAVTNPSFSSTLRQWREPSFGMYIPVTRTVWAALGSLSGRSGKLNPLPFHLANLALHLINVLLVYAILMLLVSRPWAAFAGAVLFAIHPVQVEPVAWATGMKDVLGGLFSLLALREYLKFALRAGEEETRNIARRHYALAGLCFVLALLSKPSAAGLPLICFILDVGLVRRSARSAWRALAIWVILAIPFAILTHAAEVRASAITQVPLFYRPLVALDTFAFYLWKLVWPVNLAADYGRTPSRAVGMAWVYWTWLIPAVVVWACIIARKRGPWLVSAGIFAAAILPVSGLFTFAFQGYSTVADRYMYLSLLGPALCVAILLSSTQRRPAVWSAAMAAAAFATITFLQTGIWTDSLSLFRQIKHVNPKSWLACNNLGHELDRLGRPGEAAAEYLAAIKLYPGLPEAHDNYGRLLVKENRLVEGEAEFRSAIACRAEYVDAHIHLASLLERTERIPDAIAEYVNAIGVNSYSVDAHRRLARLLAVHGRLAEAETEFRKVAVISPNDAQAHSDLGAILSMQNRQAEAEAEFRLALKCDSRCVDAQFNLGATLCARGALAEGTEHLKTAVRLQPDNMRAQTALRTALRSLGGT